VFEKGGEISARARLANFTVLVRGRGVRRNCLRRDVWKSAVSVLEVASIAVGPISSRLSVSVCARVALTSSTKKQSVWMRAARALASSENNLASLESRAVAIRPLNASVATLDDATLRPAAQVCYPTRPITPRRTHGPESRSVSTGTADLARSAHAYGVSSSVQDACLHPM